MTMTKTLKTEKKLLVVSVHAGGGCMYYSNNLIHNLDLPKEVVLSQKTREKVDIIPDWAIKYGNFSLPVRLLSFCQAIIRILKGLVAKRYSGILLCGVSNIEFYILQVWQLSRLPSFVIIHDGKMHLGESDQKSQGRIVKMMSQATHLVFLSDYVRNLVLQNFNISKPSCIAPHGLIDYGLLPAVRHSERPTILFIGRVSKYKGIELLLKAMKNVPASLYDKLIIAGKWNYENTTDYDPAKTEIIDKWLSDSEMLHYIAISDIMLFPYLEASQSGVATLAINYMRPAVVTRVGAFEEQFGNEAAIFVNPDAGELALSITGLLRHPEKMRAMREAMGKLKDRYSWANIGNTLSGYIQSNTKKTDVSC